VPPAARTLLSLVCCERIGAYPSNRIIVTFYSEQQFRDITHMPAWSDGAFDGKIRIPVQGVSQNMDQFEGVLVHELTHAMIHGLASCGVPAWLHEGLASYFEPRDPVTAQRRIRTSKTVMPISELDQSFSRFSAQQASVAYDESLVAVDTLMHLLGPRMAVLLQGLGNGQSFDDAGVNTHEASARPSGFGSPRYPARRVSPKKRSASLY
jgi:hypothetical protein